MPNHLKPLLSQIDLFYKKAGVIKVPQELLKDMCDWGISRYCQKLMEKIEEKYENANLQRIRFSRLNSNIDKLTAFAEMPAWQQFDFILHEGSINIRYFNSNEIDKDTELMGTYDWEGTHKYSLHILIAPAQEKGKFDLNLYVGDNIEPIVKPMKLDKYNISRKQIEDILDANQYLISDAIHQFAKFVEYFEVYDEEQIRNFGFMYGLAKKYFNQKYQNDVQIFDVENYDFPYSDEGDSSFKINKIICTFVPSDIEANATYSGESWSGLYRENGNIYIKKTFDFIPYSQVSFKDVVQNIARTLRHELQHLMQEQIAKTKELLEYQGVGKNRGKRFMAGLPSRKIRDKETDYSGYYEIESEPRRKEHRLRDIEFYTNLTDAISEFKRIEAIFPAEAKQWLIKYCVLDDSVFGKFRFENELSKIIAKRRGIDEWKARHIALDYMTKASLDVGNIKYMFGALRTHQPLKYDKAVKEFFKAVN